jgi:glycosyltransferase involved in cell wall biosynthesis
VTSQHERRVSARAPEDVTVRMARTDLTIVLPAYNEAARIEPALAELFGYLHRGGQPRSGGRSSDELGAWEVLVVDDGSTDDTVAIVERFPEATGVDGHAPRLRVLRCPHRGKGGAVAAGMLAANGDLVVFADADMATPPDQLPLLTAALADHDLALGSRVQPDGKDRRASQPLHRRLLGRAYRLLAGAWVTGDVPDTQCGFKGFRREVGRDLFGRLRTTGIVFDAEVIHLARRRGYSMAVVPVMWHDVRGSRMRVRPALALRVLWDLVRIPFLHRDVRRAERPVVPLQRGSAVASPAGSRSDEA